MKILVSNEIYGIKGKKREKKYMELCLQASDIEKKYKKKSRKISFELNAVKGFNSLLKD